jgi:hypothetical protein
MIVQRRDATRIFRRVHSLSYDEFCEALGVEQAAHWRDRFRMMRLNFSEGFFTLPEHRQDQLWNYAKEYEDEYRSATATV